MNSVVHLSFQGRELDFRDDGWFNATVAAATFGKTPHEWLRLPDAVGYINALERRYGEIPYVKTSKARADRGGGTWLHPKLAVAFARWLDVDFAIWCDEQIDHLIRGDSDRKRARHAAASSHKVMCEVLRVTRLAEGKETKPFHYSNESRLVNWSAGAGFSGLDREALTATELDALAQLEIQNAVMIGGRMPYDERKTTFSQTRALPAPGRQLPVRKRKRLPSKAA